MRPVAGAGRIRTLLAAPGRETREPTAAYLTGGATAVLVGWRETTIDIDLRFEPERDVLLRAVSRLKDELAINVELASPGDFIPVPDGADDRALHCCTEGSLTVYHYDLYSQAPAKVERGHDRDLDDVGALLRLGLIDPRRALEYLDEIEPQLFRFPAVDPADLRRRAEQVFGAERPA
ncbi:MAG TPA: hypothetical protein VE777_21595 [Gaiellales bacterium]|nr:hypothetical protein [Gaiellales bacterium]